MRDETLVKVLQDYRRQKIGGLGTMGGLMLSNNEAREIRDTLAEVDATLIEMGEVVEPIIDLMALHVLSYADLPPSDEGRVLMGG